MSKILRIRPETEEAYLTKSFAITAAPWYLSFKFYIPSFNVTELRGDPPFDSYNYFLAIFPSFGLLGANYGLRVDNDAYLSGLGADSGTFVADTWHDAESYYDGANIHWSVDGVEIFNYSNLLDDSQSIALYFGGIGALWPLQILYLDDVKFGTTSGGAEYFSDDFESGTFAAWDSTTGDVAIVEDTAVSFVPSAPANDNFADRELIVGASGTVSGTMVFASTEVDEPYITYLNRRSSVWYEWVAPADGTVEFSVSAINIYKACQVYSGADLASLVHLTNSTEGAGFGGDYLPGEIALNTVNVTEGVSYKVQVYTGVSGFTPPTAFTLSWALTSLLPPFIPAPSLDVDNGWFIDSMGHDFVVYQTYHPENLHFTKRIRSVEDADWEVSNTAIDTDDEVVIFRDIPTDEDSFKAWKHMFKLRLMVEGVETKIMSGPITLTNMAKGRDYVKVGGKDWMHYLDRRAIPFDPNISDNTDFNNANKFGPSFPPPQGLSYQAAARDVALIVQDILEFIEAADDSLPITNSLSAIGTAINYSLSLGDTSTALKLFDGLSEYWPGFDYRVSYDREFVLWAPFRFGDPDTTADDGADGDNIAYAFGDYYDHPVVDVEYTNTGPQATHLFGTGAGSAGNRVGKSLGASDIQAGYWRLDGSADFGDQAKTLDIVAKRARREFIFQAQEVHEIELTVDPQTVPDFWSVIRPGFAIWLKEDLIMHGIDSAQRIVSMELTKNEQNDELVKLGLNQIYNTSTHYGVDQA